MYALAATFWDSYTRAPKGRSMDSALDSTVGLVGAARERRENPLSARHRLTGAIGAASFLAAAIASVLVLPWEPQADPLLVVLLVVLYAVVSQVDFEIGNGQATPEQLVLIPMLFLAPLALVPLLVAAGFMLSKVRQRLRDGLWDQSLYDLAWNWFPLGAVGVLATLAPEGPPSLEHTGVYVLAFVAMVVVGTVNALVCERYMNGLKFREVLWPALWSYRVDAVLAPIALMVAMEAYETPAALAAVVPLVWLLHVFSYERRERHSASLELANAYRGTVMLLSDVVEAEDDYTAYHCRSVVELVAEVAEEMAIPRADRQELEFAALLHDVGKIAIPKEILNKPSKLTDEEFELIKTHTIEGQQLLDRVGGLMGRVGKVVRSCHERWDGKGYPDGLAGEEIPLSARIVFCCDAYNAMTTDRPYRKAMPREDALAEIRDNAGSQFDPVVAASLERVILDDDRYPRLVEGVAASHAIAATLGVGRDPVPAGAEAEAVDLPAAAAS
jgi:HD-GYP domain-containing protein (c-di-GMP phosphodiesterase class II)